MIKIENIISYLENIAPLAYQESYDNSGFMIGDKNEKIQGVLTCLDITEEVIEEAKKKRCNLIISHHPLLFQGVKKIVGSDAVQKMIRKAIVENIHIYAIHTNLDNVYKDGVNPYLAKLLGLVDISILLPKKDILLKLTTTVPKEHKSKVLQALFQAGAGEIGNYSSCSFQIEGEGTFQPEQGANPFIGKKEEMASVKEIQIEVMLPVFLKEEIVKVLKQTHPYEEVSYYFHYIKNEHQQVGAGVLGYLKPKLRFHDFFPLLKKTFSLSAFKYTPPLSQYVEKVAICGGSGSFLIKKAIQEKVDIFITADIKYHEFFLATGNICLIDIGHYESEVNTKYLLVDILKRQFPQLHIFATEENTNPISYYL